MTYDQWFQSQQGVAYDGSYVFAKAAWHFKQDEIEALEARVKELEGVIDKCRFALEPYDDIKPRDWKTDREKLRFAHKSAVAALAKEDTINHNSNVNTAGSGSNHRAYGVAALQYNTAGSGSNNTAFGVNSLQYNTDGSGFNNTAFGEEVTE
jgi:hypothetical protein